MRIYRHKFTESNIPPSVYLKVRHLTEPVWNDDRFDWDHHYNGVTVARLYDRQTDELLAEGDAACNVGRDMPNRKIGRAIAVGRALKAYYEPTLQLVHTLKRETGY